MADAAGEPPAAGQEEPRPEAPARRLGTTVPDGDRRGARLRQSLTLAPAAGAPAVAERSADLEALLAYEEASKSRAPFQTLLANRITRATAK